jgi:hypothetical protein
LRPHAGTQEGFDAGKAKKHTLLILGFGNAVGKKYDYISDLHFREKTGDKKTGR